MHDLRLWNIHDIICSRIPNWRYRNNNWLLLLHSCTNRLNWIGIKCSHKFLNVRLVGTYLHITSCSCSTHSSLLRLLDHKLCHATSHKNYLSQRYFRSFRNYWWRLSLKTKERFFITIHRLHFNLRCCRLWFSGS